MGSNYVLAALYSTFKILKIYFDKSKMDLLHNFLNNVCNKFLYSYGLGFTQRKDYTKFNKMKSKTMKIFRESGFFDTSELFLDSGGFQVSIGAITRKESKILLDLYYEYLTEYEYSYDKAFILDYAPGFGCKVFKDFDDVYKTNLKSYQKALDLKKEIKDKLIYVHHFSTPKIWKIFNKILDSSDDMFNSFNYFATGGIVANMQSDFEIPCIMYCLPLITLLNRCKKFNKKELRFHILGGAHFRDILFYELFKIHVKKYHDINLEMTYDSSGVFKNFFIARRTFILLEDDFTIDPIRVDSDSLLKKYKTGQTYEEIFISCVNNFMKKFGFEELFPPLYNPKTNNFFDEMKVPFLLYGLYIYKAVEDYFKIVAKDLYSFYDNEEIELFHINLLEVLKKVNGGKFTRKQLMKASTVAFTLDMLKNLDEDFCQRLVNLYLAKEEFTNLDNKNIIKF